MAKTLKEIVQANSKQEGDCMVWQGSLHRGEPCLYIRREEKRELICLRRYVAAKKFSLLRNHRKKVVSKCGNPLCFNPEHIEIESYTRTHKNNASVKARDMQLNKAVFDSRITNGVDHTAEVLGVSVGTVIRISNHKAMLPYLQIKLQHFLGVSDLDQVKNVPNVELQSKFGLSKFAIDYIKQDDRYNVKDEDIFFKLLDECMVVGEHLVWVGQKSATGTPLTSLFGNNRKSIPLFMFATHGGVTANKFRNKCGYDGCVNPFHQEEIDDDMVT